MNMISTGAFLTEMDASDKQETLAEQFARVWEKKNSRVARAGGVSLMALSLAACGSSSSDTAAVEEPVVEEPVVEEPVVEEPTTPVVNELALTTSSTDDITGTAGVDSITAAVSALSAVRTLQVTDAIDGGDGSDSMDLQLDAAFTGFTTGSMVGVETVNVTTAGSVARNFDASGVTGATTYNLTGAVNLTDLAEFATVNAGARTADLTIAYATKVADGTADVQTLSITDFGTSATSATGITLSNVETTDLTVSGTNFVDAGNVGSKAITVAGDGALTVTGVNAALKTYDGSGATGAQDLTLAGASTMTSVKTGSGDDVLAVVIDDDVAANATINAGEGADTMTMTSGAGTTVQLSMTGVETLQVGDLAGAVTMSMSKSSGLTNINVLGTAADEGDMDENLTLSSVGDGAMTISVQGANASGAILSSDHTGASTISIDTPASTATATTRSSNDVDLTLSKTSSLDIDVAAKMDYAGVITAAKAESAVISIAGGTTSAAQLVLAAATTVTVDEVAAASELRIDAAAATEVNITNAKNLILDGGSDLSAVEYFTSSGKGDLDLLDAATPVDLAAISTVSVTNTGEVDMEDLGAAGLDNSITATFDGSETLTIKDTKTNGQNISITAINQQGAIDINAIDAKTTGNVTLTIDGDSTMSVAAITGKNVSVDISDLSGAATHSADITVSGNLTYVGNALQQNDLATNNVVLDGATNTVDFTGGLLADSLDIIGDTTTTSLTVKGDFGLGTDAVTIDLATNDLAAAGTVDITGMSNYDAINISVSDAKGTTVKLGSGTDVDTITFGAADQAITVTGFQTKSTDDVVNVELTGGGNIAGKTAIAADAVATDVTTAFAVVFADGSDGTGAEAIADYADLADVAAFISGGLTLLTGEVFTCFINDLANDMVYIYNVVEGSGASADTTIDADEVVSLGSIALADADTAFTIANVDFTA